MFKIFFEQSFNVSKSFSSKAKLFKSFKLSRSLTDAL